MAAKSTSTSVRRTRKTKTTTSSTKVVSNILFIDSKRRRELADYKYQQDLDNFEDQLTDEEHDLVCDYLDILFKRNVKKAIPPELRKVIPFPIQNKRIASKEA